MALRIAYIEPYFGGSHRAFAEGFAANSRHDVVLFTHPATFWKWRMQGASLTLAEEFVSNAGSRGPFDLVLATSMLDLARFLGFARRAVADAPVVLYMHENQLTYPPVPGDERDDTYAVTNWAAMAAADLVLFNSHFHRCEWFTALPGLLRRLPDRRHVGLVAAVEKRSEVMPVGVDLARLDGVEATPGERPTVLWNQRWDHDKGPDEFAAAVTAAFDAGLDFDIALAGEQFVNDPASFQRLRMDLGDHLVHDGFAEPDVYAELLTRSDIVISTSHQEFFGIAVTEAVYAGAFPLLPDRLVYPERLPESHHERCLYNGRADLVGKLRWALSHRDEASRLAASLRPVMAQFDWSVVGPRLDARLEGLVRVRD